METRGISWQFIQEYQKKKKGTKDDSLIFGAGLNQKREDRWDWRIILRKKSDIRN